MKFITAVLLSLLLTTVLACSHENYDPPAFSGGGDGVGVEDDADISDAEDDGDVFVEESWGVWTQYFVRNDWGQELPTEALEPYFEGNDEEDIEEDATQACINWFWDQLPQLGGVALATGEEAFARAYNLLLNQEGADAYGVAAAQRCLEEVQRYLERQAFNAAPIMAWLVPALAVVQNRERFFLGPNCLR